MESLKHRNPRRVVLFHPAWPGPGGRPGSGPGPPPQGSRTTGLQGGRVGSSTWASGKTWQSVTRRWPSWLPAPGSRGFGTPDGRPCPGPRSARPSSESCSQVHMPSWLSSSPRLQIIRLSLMPAAGSPTGGRSRPAPRRPLCSGLWWERSPFLQPRPLSPAWATTTWAPPLRCHPHTPWAPGPLAWARTGRAGALFLKPLRATDLSEPGTGKVGAVPSLLLAPGLRERGAGGRRTA